MSKSINCHITPRPTPNGVKAFCCYFSLNGKSYYADLVEGQLRSLVPINEIMIFPVSKSGEVDCGKVLYESHPMTVDEATLEQHIQTFCKDILSSTASQS